MIPRTGGRWQVPHWQRLLAERDTSPWNGVILPLAERLHSRRWARRSGRPGADISTIASELASISPARVFHWLNSFQRIQDYTQFLKGAGRNRWSNVLLAQAFSRIVTGWEVKADLGALELSGSGEAPEPAQGVGLDHDAYDEDECDRPGGCADDVEPTEAVPPQRSVFPAPPRGIPSG